VTTTAEEITDGSFVNPGLACQVAARPATKNPRPIDHGYVDGPLWPWSYVDSSIGGSGSSITALEGTVLRVPCIPSERQRAPLTSIAQRFSGF
jgi:hypothetical protein